MKRGLCALVLVALAGCAGNAWPQPTPPSAKPGVALVGDSLLFQAAPYVAGALAWYAVDAPLTNRTAGGVGLLDDGFHERLAPILDDLPEGSVVVYQYSGNCFFGPGGGCPHVPGTAAFIDAWAASMRLTITAARERGLQPLWVISPRFGPAVGGHAETVVSIRNATLAVAEEMDVAVVDWGGALHDVYGGYQQLLWYADVFAEPAWHAVRDPDGVHLAPDGARRAASWTAYAVARLTAAP